jgi:hypothetical protein
MISLFFFIKDMISLLAKNIFDTFAFVINATCFYRDLTGNQLNGSIPSGLLKRSQNGTLTLRQLHAI